MADGASVAARFSESVRKCWPPLVCKWRNVPQRTTEADDSTRTVTKHGGFYVFVSIRANNIKRVETHPFNTSESPSLTPSFNIAMPYGPWSWYARTRSTGVHLKIPRWLYKWIIPFTEQWTYHVYYRYRTKEYVQHLRALFNIYICWFLFSDLLNM